jgi:NAD(P)-dependent dehydrogenase (short-subunit alcohol dehydrogenase family)
MGAPYDGGSGAVPAEGRLERQTGPMVDVGDRDGQPDTPRRVMIVTGGSRGIGAATARLAAAEGYAVVVNYTADRASAEAVVADCVGAGAPAVAHRADVADEGAVEAMFEEAARWGGGLHVLVNNAGVLRPQMRLDEMTVQRWREVFDVNVIGAFLCARAAVRRMSTRFGGSGGAIVNVSSAASYLGSPEEYVDYAASKAALDTMTVGLGKELAEEGVRVNAVRPGVIRTEIHASGGEPGRVERVAPTVPMRRGGDPEEVARAILWLASDSASYVTATTLNVSGGR